MDNQQPCIWATSKNLWDSFLNDPDLAQAIDKARQNPSQEDVSVEPIASDIQSERVRNDTTPEQRIRARLQAYETPITDEILRQSIR